VKKNLRIKKYLVILLAIILIGCESQNKKRLREKRIELKRKVATIKYVERLYRKPAILLSFKYNLSEQKVFTMLLDEYDIYNRLASTATFTFPTQKPSDELRKRIKNYSKQYNIPPIVIANIFIDYETMR